MKMSKEELSQKINEMEIDEDKKISLLEDISDSFIEEDTSKYDELNQKYEELKQNYKERFLIGDTSKKEDTKEEELKEEKIIDIKEI